MKTINNNANIENFNAWSGAKDTKKTILENNKADEFNNLIGELYPNGIDETKLNDILWHDTEWVYEMLGISDEEE